MIFFTLKIEENIFKPLLIINLKLLHSQTTLKSRPIRDLYAQLKKLSF